MTTLILGACNPQTVNLRGWKRLVRRKMLGAQTLKSVRSLSEITSGPAASADNQGNNKLKRQIHAMASHTGGGPRPRGDCSYLWATYIPRQLWSWMVSDDESTRIWIWIYMHVVHYVHIFYDSVISWVEFISICRWALHFQPGHHQVNTLPRPA